MLNSWVDKFIDALWFDIGVFDKKKTISVVSYQYAQNTMMCFHGGNYQ